LDTPGLANSAIAERLVRIAGVRKTQLLFSKRPKPGQR
jgi:hypothetical protein